MKASIIWPLAAGLSAVAMAIALLAAILGTQSPTTGAQRVCYDTQGPLLTGTLSIRNNHLYVNNTPVPTDVVCYPIAVIKEKK